MCRLAVTIALLLLMSAINAAPLCKRNEFGVFEDIVCASDAHEKANKELSVVFRRVLAGLDPDEQIKLRQAQQAWIAYRDADTAFVRFVEGDGSAGRLVAFNNAERLTRRRIADLKLLVKVR